LAIAGHSLLRPGRRRASTLARSQFDAAQGAVLKTVSNQYVSTADAADCEGIDSGRGWLVAAINMAIDRSA